MIYVMPISDVFGYVLAVVARIHNGKIKRGIKDILNLVAQHFFALLKVMLCIKVASL